LTRLDVKSVKETHPVILHPRALVAKAIQLLWQCCLGVAAYKEKRSGSIDRSPCPLATGLTQHRWAGTACRWRPARQPKRMYDPLNTRLIIESSSASVSHLLLSPCAIVWRSLSGTNLTPPMPNRDLMSRSRGVDNVCHTRVGQAWNHAPCWELCHQMVHATAWHNMVYVEFSVDRRQFL